MLNWLVIILYNWVYGIVFSGILILLFLVKFLNRCFVFFLFFVWMIKEILFLIINLGLIFFGVFVNIINVL